MNRLSQILEETSVKVGIKASSKKRVFEQASLLFESKCGVARDRVFNSLFSREKLGSTGLGNEIAIPHGRINGIDQAFSVVMSLAEPVAFDANDEKPVLLLVFLLVPIHAEQSHLDILSDVAEMLSDVTFVSGLKKSEDAKSLYQKLRNWTSVDSKIY